MEVSTGRLSPRGVPVIAILLYSVLHAALLLHDAASPDSFLSYDRALVRIAKIDALLGASGDWLATLIANSAPGDYLFHAAAYALAGRFGVIALQLLLGLIGLIYAYRLAAAILGSERAAGGAACLYVILPGSLWQPHVLSTEGVANPLIVVALFYAEAYFAGWARFGQYLAGLLIFGLVIFIRPQFLLFPFVLAVIGGLRPAPRRWPAVLAPALSLLPTLCWTLTLLIATGSPSDKTSDHGLAATLAERAERTSALGHFDLATDASGNPVVSPSMFLQMALAHPVPMLKTYVSDAVNLVLNPGLSGLSNYLGLFSDYAGEYWTELRDRVGYVGVAKQILTTNLGFAAVMLVGGTVWLAALIAIAFGIRPVFFNRQPLSA